MKEKKVRITVDIFESSHKEILQMMDELGIQTHREMFINAYSLTVWLIRQKKMGRMIGAIDVENKHMIELDSPFLNRVKVENKTPVPKIRIE